MNVRNSIIIIISTFFYIGFFPLIPGTFASIIAALLFYFIKDNILIYSLFTVLIIILGFLVSGKAEKIFQKNDPRCVVIDEIAGMLLSFVMLTCSLRLVVVGFVLFRILDSMKPFPISKIQRLKAGLGIMGDDIVAGLYTNIILQYLVRFAS